MSPPPGRRDEMSADSGHIGPSAVGVGRIGPSVQRLGGVLGRARRAVALTGAGVSVPSGIPDFRTPETGLWAKVDPMEVAHIGVFERDPERFWSYYRPRLQALGDKEPNRAHAALAELERRGLIEGVITPNIDRLHRAAGAGKVIEGHRAVETNPRPGGGAAFELGGGGGLFAQ